MEGPPAWRSRAGEKFGAFAYYCWAAGAVTLVLTALQ